MQVWWHFGCRVPLCMTPNCPVPHLPRSHDRMSSEIVRFGFFKRNSDGHRWQRYRCKHCGKTFSDAGSSLQYWQRLRFLEKPLFVDLVSGISQRRASYKHFVNRKTVVRKFVRMGKRSVEQLRSMQVIYPKAEIIEFDDLETCEITKCKPLSVTLAVEHKCRRILGFRVAQMPAKGPLASIALKKYGPREDHRPKARAELFSDLAKLITPTALIKSDKNPHYGPDVKRYFPTQTHKIYKGRKACTAGQGELKKGGFDPLFCLNHTCAMLRANINRLFRRTWCVTKKAERLEYHIAMYAMFHNLVLTHINRKQLFNEYFGPG